MRTAQEAKDTKGIRRKQGKQEKAGECKRKLEKVGARESMRK
jgi:hypothetical protein